MKKVIFLLGLSLLLLGGLTGWTWYHEGNNQILIIDTKKVLENYQGFKDAQDIFEKKSQEYDHTLARQLELYQSQKQDFDANKDKWDEKRKLVAEKELSNLSQTFSSLQQNIDAKKKEEEARLLEGVYNQVDAFIESYCQENDIHVVLGANGTGNIVYNSGKIDKTQEIIEMLNKKYLNE